jgi:hypothetical protein
LSASGKQGFTLHIRHWQAAEKAKVSVTALLEKKIPH